jgi:hypothetical protein
VYPVIVEPPLLIGADHVTVAIASPTVATTFSGIDGAVAAIAGITLFVAAEGDDDPMALIAVTVNV